MSPFFSRLIVKLLFYTPSTKCSLINCTSFVNIYQKYWFQFFDMFPRHRLINIIIRLNEFLRYLQISPDFLVSFKILTRRDWQILHLLQILFHRISISFTSVFCHYGLELIRYIRIAKLDSLQPDSRTINCIVKNSSIFSFSWWVLMCLVWNFPIFHKAIFILDHIPS